MYTPLFNAQMCIDGGVARCASQVFVFSVGDVLSSAVVSVLLRQAKVNKEQLVRRKGHIRDRGHSNAVRQKQLYTCCNALNMHRFGWKTPHCCPTVASTTVATQETETVKTSSLSPSSGGV